MEPDRAEISQPYLFNFVIKGELNELRKFNLIEMKVNDYIQNPLDEPESEEDELKEKLRKEMFKK